MSPVHMRLTHKQREILGEIDSSYINKGYPPTFNEMAKNLSITVGTVHRHLLALRRKGLIEWDSREKRTLRRTHGTETA